MKVAIVGYGIEGQAALKYWQRQGADITVCDQNTENQPPDGIAYRLGPGYLDGLDNFDLVFRSAGIHPNVLLRDNPRIERKITSTMNEFFRVCPTKHVIGVTGTKGKGTTSTLTTRLLEATHEDVRLGGNIGTSPFDFLLELTKDSWVVLECSSFQLIDLKYSPAIALCLMVVPEHLDWHGNMEDYVEAKTQLFKHQAPYDLAIYYASSDVSKRIASSSPGRKLPYYAQPGAYIENNMVMIAGQEILHTSELKLLGKHNWQNVCAALTVVWQTSQDIPAMRSVLTTFSGLPHRLESVRKKDGVTFYNDSFAATPDAAMAAIDAIVEPKVVILGGFDRQLPIGHLAQCLVDYDQSIRKAVIIGASAGRLAAELDKIGYANYTVDDSKDMSRIVQHAAGFAQPGDAVLLSPGFTSFDMFKNFVERGEQFKSAVWEL